MFLVGLFGAIVARGVARRGPPVLYRVAFLLVTTVLALTAAEVPCASAVQARAHERQRGRFRGTQWRRPDDSVQ